LERFRGLLRKTSTHGFSEPIQLNIFIDELRPQSKQLLDASAGGKIKLKTPDEAMELIENMAASDHAILRGRAHIPTKRSLLELSSQDALLEQNKLLSKQLEALTETLSKLPTQSNSIQPSPFVVLQVVSYVVEHMNPATVFPKKKHLIKSTTWGTSQDKISMQVDIPDFSMASHIIHSRDSGGITLETSSTRTRVVHLIDHNNKGLVSMFEQQSWKRLLLSSCKYLCQTKRAQSLPSKIWKSKWDS